MSWHVRISYYTAIRNIGWGKKNRIAGVSGCKHQIDLSFLDYDFQEPVLVLIECKNTPSVPIEKVQVAAFKAVVDDVLNEKSSLDRVLGIFAYADRARSGAIKFAQYYGIQMEKTGMKPNFAFKYQNLVQAGIRMQGTSSMRAHGTVIKS